MLDINQIDNDYFNQKRSHNICGESILTPNANKTDCNRLQMFTNNIMQCIQTVKNEPPLVYSGFENQVGKYSTGYKYLKGNYKVIKKIYKNKFNYILIIQNLDTEEYDIIFRTTAHWLTEHFGYKNKNKVIDRIKEGDEVSNKVLYRNLNYDDYMNFQYGTNLNAVYIPYKGFTNEDAIVISESTAKKMSSYFVKRIKVNVNTNDLLCNLYGNENFYKTFPDIGEDIKDSILLARRRIVYENNIVNLKHLDKIQEDDDITYFNGKIIDINVYSNFPLVNMEKQEYNKQVYAYIIKLRKYYKEVITFLDNIRSNNKDYKFSDDLFDEYNRCLKFMDDNAKLANAGKEFDNYVLEFTILHKKPLTIGSKLTGRYGNKGVVSLILPDDQMPEIEYIDGEEFKEENNPIKKYADICLNPSGIINRLNPSQLFEQELNFISQIVRYRMSKMETLEEKWNYLYKYISMVNSEQAELMEEFYNSLTEPKKERFIYENIYERIFINQKPFWGNIEIHQLAKIYDEFNISKYKFKGISQSLVMGELYFLRLKHDPADKFSARSVDNNNYKDLPTKSRTFKDSKVPYSNTPIRIGEMETTNLGLSGDNRPVKELLDSYANNPEKRKDLIESLLTTNPFDPEVDFSNSESNNVKILNSYFGGLGVEIINNQGESNIKKMYKDDYSPEALNDDDYNYQQFLKDKFLKEESEQDD